MKKKMETTNGEKNRINFHIELGNIFPSIGSIFTFQKKRFKIVLERDKILSKTIQQRKGFLAKETDESTRRISPKKKLIGIKRRNRKEIEQRQGEFSWIKVEKRTYTNGFNHSFVILNGLHDVIVFYFCLSN